MACLANGRPDRFDVARRGTAASANDPNPGFDPLGHVVREAGLGSTLATPGRCSPRFGGRVVGFAGIGIGQQRTVRGARHAPQDLGDEPGIGAIHSHGGHLVEGS